jgi:hypothetical protein
VYPFFLPGALTPVYLSLAARRNGRGHAPSPWASEPDFVLDMLTSGETRSWSGYDRVRLDALEAQFRQGRYAEIDWFLAFELWRRAHAIT